jgi:hypothetical protein
VNVDDVRAAVAASDLDDRDVMIGPDRGFPGVDNVSVLLHRQDGSWFTAYFERGRYHDPRTFDTEDAACRDFLAMVHLTSPDAGS